MNMNRKNLGPREFNAIEAQLKKAYPDGFSYDIFGDTIYVKDGRGRVNSRLPYPVEGVLKAAKLHGFY